MKRTIRFIVALIGTPIIPIFFAIDLGIWAFEDPDPSQFVATRGWFKALTWRK